MSRIIRFKCLAAAVLVLSLVQPVLADDSSKLPGLWRLVSYVIEVQATGEILPAMGKNPTGYVLFTQEGRAFFILTGDGRKPAKTVQERAELLEAGVEVPERRPPVVLVVGRHVAVEEHDERETRLPLQRLGIFPQAPERERRRPRRILLLHSLHTPTSAHREIRPG